jgi:lysophospholipase L1-like esterase
MQKSRRWSRLEQYVLPVAATLFGAACGGAQSAAPPASNVTTGGEPAAVVVPETAPADPAAPSGDNSTERSVTPDAPAAASATAPPVPAQPVAAELPKDTLVLHVGDSFAGSLGVPLGKRFKAAGLRTVLEFETSSYIPTWASGEELEKYVGRYMPDLVLVTLGANEFEIPNPEQRANAVRRLVKRLNGVPCVWISPPKWKEDTGVLAVVRDNCAPCRYLDSDTIVKDLPRRKDGIHPSDDAREIWADAVLAWLTRERAGSPEHAWELRAERPATASEVSVR